MDKKETTTLLPQTPSATTKCWWRLATRTTGRILLGYVVILLFSTALVAPLGGPREPPNGMSWNDFEKWKDDGTWWKESVRTGVVVASIGFALMFIGKKAKPSN